MPSAVTLKLAIDRYDRHIPFFDRTLPIPEGLALEVHQTGQSTQLRDGTNRHRLMLDGHYDAAEFSLSSYLIARERGYPITAIPVFPRRLFSQSQMWVHPDSPYEHVRDLRGRKVALSAFQTTLSLLARGDMKSFYDTPWEDIHWLLTSPEQIAFEAKPGVRIDYIGNRQGLGVALEQGEIDAFFLPHPPHDVSTGRTKARRLFRDSRAEELRYYREVGDFPIMHLIAIRQAVVEAHPWIPMALYHLFNEAKDLAEACYEDPNWSRLAWGLHDLEEERRLFGRDPWENGFRRNRTNLQRFMDYAQDQQLIKTAFNVEQLFTLQTLET